MGYLTCCRAIIDRHRIGSLILHHPPKQDRRHRAALSVATLVAAGRLYRNPYEPVAGQGTHPGQNSFFVFRLLVAVEQHQRIAPFGHSCLGSTNEPREERVGKVGDDQGDKLAAAPLQVSSRRHRRIVEFLNRRHHPCLQGNADIGRAVDHGRNRCGRNAGGFGDIAYSGQNHNSS